MLYNTYVAGYLTNDTPNHNKATNENDIERYGNGTKVHTALVILNEAYGMFPEYKHAIEELENEIRWIGNEWGSETIEKRAEKLLMLEAAKSLSTVEQVLAVAYPNEAFVFNIARLDADRKTKEIYNQDGIGTDVANAFKHIYWSAYATNEVGEKYAKLFTFAHEFGWHKENKNDPEALKMDLHNNQRGIIIGEKYPKKRLEEAVLYDIAVGNAAVIKNGKSVLTTPEWRNR